MEQELTAQKIIEFLIIFVLNFVGSYAKDFLDMVKKKNSCHKIQYNKVLISAFGMAILSWAGSDIALKHISSKVFMGVNFLLGLMSYSILTQINTLEGLMKFAKTLKAFYEFSNNISKK